MSSGASIRCLVLLTAFVALATADRARAARLVTLDAPSRHVDAAREPMGLAPVSAAERPHALRLNVLLPDHYDDRPGDFPVLYLLHGVNAAYDHWAHPERGDVARVAHDLDAIVVMPDGGAIGLATDWWYGGRRGAPAWESYFLEDVIGLVERRFRVRPGRRWHALAGFSGGGFSAASFGGRRPGYFGTVALFSACCLDLTNREETDAFEVGFFLPYRRSITDIWGGPDGFYRAGHNPIGRVANLRHTRVYASVGDGMPRGPEDLATGYEGYGAPAPPLLLRPPGVTAFAVSLSLEIERRLRTTNDAYVAAARSDGVDVTYRPMTGTHWWPSWRRMLSDAIGWGLFAPVPESPEHWTYETVARTGRMWDLRFAFTDPPTTVQTFRRSGRTLNATGRGTVELTMPGGCRLTATLPVERTVPACAPRRRLRMTVRPGRAIAGRRTRFEIAVFTVARRSRRAVRGARVSFAGATVRTNARGRAVMTRRLVRPRRYRLRATKRGLRSATGYVTVVRVRR